MRFLTIKKLVASLLALSAIIGMLTVGTHALFTDSTANTGNSIGSGELTAPSLSQPTASGGSVPLSWTAATLPGNASHEDEITYTVERQLGSGSFGSAGGTCTGSLSTTTCTDSLSTGGTYTYRVIAHFRSWTATSNERTVTVALGGAPGTPTTVTLANGGGVGNAYINDANKSNLSVNVGLPASSVATNTVHVVITDGAAHSTVDETTAATTGAGTATVTGIDASGLDDGSVTIHATSSNGSGTSPEKTESVTKDTVKPTSQVEPVTSITSGNTFAVPYTSGDASPSSTLEKIDLYVDPPGGGTNFSLTNTDSDPSASGESFTYTGATADGAYGFYTRATDEAGNVENAPGAADRTATKTTTATTPPTVTAAVIAKTDGLPNSTAGFLRAFAGNLGTYKVYANATAGSNSISTVTASLTNLGGGAAVSLSTCSSDCTVNGVTYGYVSATETAAATGAGSVGFSVTATDTASAMHTLNRTVTVDNTAPMGTTIATGNGGSNDGLAEPGDTLTFGYSEAIDGISLVSAWNWPWTTASNDVRVTLTNANPDTVTITTAGGGALPLGTIALDNNGFVTGTAGATAVFGGTGATTPSTISLSGSTVTVTLGSRNGGAGTVADVNASSVVVTWTPTVGASGAYDRAGNRLVANSPAARTNTARQF